MNKSTTRNHTRVHWIIKGAWLPKRVLLIGTNSVLGFHIEPFTPHDADHVIR